jgi:MFS family permease
MAHVDPIPPAPSHLLTRREGGARRRPTLSGRMAYALVASVIGLGLFASVTPSPLYHAYAVLWHFSPLMLTLIYATYAFGVLATLLVAGSVSDQVGRRPVLVVALAGLMASAVVYMLASSVAWLFVARGLQGLATGAALSTASAAMLDLHPSRDAAGVGITNGVVSTAGIGLGMLVSASLVQLGWQPRVTPYLFLLALYGVALVGALCMPEPVASRQRLTLRPQRPSVPAAVRHPFVLAALAVLSSWSIGGLFFSLGPELAFHLFRTTNVIVSGIGVVALAGSATVAGMVLGRITPWIGASAGSVILAAGMIVIVLAAAADSSVLFLGGSVLGGVGFGLAFLGGLRGLVAAIPHEHRGAVMSAFYIVAYASLSVPAVLAGVVVSHLGLQSTFEMFGSIVAGIALIVAFEAFRTRPTTVRNRGRVRVPVEAPIRVDEGSDLSAV